MIGPGTRVRVTHSPDVPMAYQGMAGVVTEVHMATNRARVMLPSSTTAISFPVEHLITEQDTSAIEDRLTRLEGRTLAAIRLVEILATRSDIESWRFVGTTALALVADHYENAPPIDPGDAPRLSVRQEVERLRGSLAMAYGLIADLTGVTLRHLQGAGHDDDIASLAAGIAQASEWGRRKVLGDTPRTQTKAPLSDDDTYEVPEAISDSELVTEPENRGDGNAGNRPAIVGAMVESWLVNRQARGDSVRRVIEEEGVILIDVSGLEEPIDEHVAAEIWRLGALRFRYVYDYPAYGDAMIGAIRNYRRILAQQDQETGKVTR